MQVFESSLKTYQHMNAVHGTFYVLDALIDRAETSGLVHTGSIAG